MKLRHISEGISIDPATGELAFDFQSDSPTDILKFFDKKPYVTNLGNNLFAGFIFSDASPDMQSHENEKNIISLAKAYKSFGKEYKDLVNRHSVRSIEGLEIQNVQAFTADLKKLNSYTRLKKMLGGTQVDAAINSGGTNSITVGSNIKELIDQQYDWSLVLQYIRGEKKLPGRSKTESGTNKSDLKSDYDRVKNRIMRALNSGVTGGDEQIEHFVYFAAERLSNFNGFGFTPDFLVRPHSNSALLRDFVDMVADERGIPAVVGLKKSRSNVTYQDEDGELITVVDSSGRANPKLDDNKWIGQGVTLATVGDKIVADRFKITHLYPNNRTRMQGLFKTTPELEAHLTANPNSGALMIDDSIFSGTTQREMMGQLKQLSIANVASYAIIKA